MHKSIYDSCFLYSDIERFDTERFGIERLGIERFDMIDLQTNDFLIVENEVFVDVEDKRLKKSKLLVKDRQKFIIEQSIKFNDERINKDSEKTIYLNQKKTM